MLSKLYPAIFSPGASVCRCQSLPPKSDIWWQGQEPNLRGQSSFYAVKIEKSKCRFGLLNFTAFFKIKFHFIKLAADQYGQLKCLLVDCYLLRLIYTAHFAMKSAQTATVAVLVSATLFDATQIESNLCHVKQGGQDKYSHKKTSEPYHDDTLTILESYWWRYLMLCRYQAIPTGTRFVRYCLVLLEIGKYCLVWVSIIQYG